MELDVDFGEFVGDVPLPLLRMIDLARALARDPQLLMLDEITAALPSDLAERVFAVMRSQRERGRSVLFITHRLNEVIQTCDRATILRDGGAVATIVPQEGGEETIVAHMLGEAVARAAVGGGGARTPTRRRGRGRRPSGADRARGRRPHRRRPARRLVLARAGRGARDRRARRAGAGRAVRRARRRGSASDGGEIRVAGKPLKARHPYDAIRAGVVLVPADRLHALLPQRSVRENIASPRYNTVRRWGPISMRDEGRRVREAIDALQIDTRAAPPGAPALGRQPAEGDDRALARLGLQDDALLRPDARDRRRHQAPDLRAAAEPRRRRRRDPLLLERARRVPARLRPRADALRRADHRRASRARRPTRRRSCARCTASSRTRRRWHERDDRHRSPARRVGRRAPPRCAGTAGRSASTCCCSCSSSTGARRRWCRGGRSTCSRSASTRCRSRSPPAGRRS